VQNLFVVPATIDLAGAEIELVPAFSRELKLRRALAQISGIPARPPLPVQPLLNDSVPLLHVPPLWDGGLRGAGIRVGIVDTGIDALHPDLAGRIAAHADFSGAGANDDVGHGTHVAGIIAGIVWATDHGADVINMSFSNPGYSPALTVRRR